MNELFSAARRDLNEGMASKGKRKGGGSAITAPKGHATAGRGETTERGPRITPMMEWIIAIVVIVGIIAAIFVIFADVRTPLGGHSGLAPEPVPVEVVDVG